MSQIDERISSMSVFERHLTVWVALCIVGGILLGKFAPGIAETLDGMAISVNGAPVVSVPIAICLFLFWAMLYYADELNDWAASIFGVETAEEAPVEPGDGGDAKDGDVKDGDAKDGDDEGK